MLRLLRRGLSSVKDKIRKERAQRLGKIEESLPTRTNDNLEKIRNIAIIAHIDAGKTTTTERMLFYAGALPEPGEVDDGTTTMDYLPQERARGITIRSAAISFNWDSHQINLIDTPGHVDFSGEVARSLRVLDGVVTIFDAVHGVQTQTEKVWREASQRNLPKIAFINKMDRLGASVPNTLRTIQERLDSDSLVLQEPIGEFEMFKGVVDLLTLQSTLFEGFKGETLTRKKLTESDGLYQRSVKARNNLIERLSEYDDQIADLYLTSAPVSADLIRASVKKVLCNPKYVRKVCAVLMGASVRNRGVQCLLDGIISYLPSPTERPPIVSLENSKLQRRPIKTEHFCGYIFKIIHDKDKGPLSYVRIYSGTLSRSMTLKNSTKECIEKIQFLYRVRADQYVLVNEVYAGDIVAIAGLKHSAAGDTLINVQDERFVLEQLKLPSAIFMAPFEVESMKDQQLLQQHLKTITSEDNSLQYKADADTGQLVVSGLGELHLEIIRDRITEAGVKVLMGKLRIGYRESLNDKVKKSLRFSKQINKQDFWFELELEFVPVRGDNDEFKATNEVVISFPRSPDFDRYWAEFQKRKAQAKNRKRSSDDSDESTPVRGQEAVPTGGFGKVLRNPTKLEPIDDEAEELEYPIAGLPFEHLDSIVESIQLSLLSGRFRYPVISLEVHITGGKFEPSKVNRMIVTQCATKIAKEALQECVLLEPFVSVELIGEEVMLEHAIRDIIKKRGRVEQRENRRVLASVPAEGIRGWVKSLRAMGFDTTMKFSGYEQVQGCAPEVLVAAED